MKISTKNFLLVLTLSLLSGCRELGTDEKGKFKAYLILKATSGEIREFYLGGYSTLSRCIAVLDNEIDSYERETNGKFFTNTAFTYGGFKTESLRVENQIAGAKCSNAESN